jgi:hypothetical protein
MKSSAKPNDKFACVLLSAFLLMGSAHFACRYDVPALVEGLFPQASAETVLQQTLPVASPAPAQALVRESAPFVVATIARNPFQVPAAALPKPVSAQPAPSPGGKPAPLYSTEPMLRGIVAKGEKSLHHRIQRRKPHYAIGQTVAGSTLSGIYSKSVRLHSSDGSYELKLGGKR